MLVVVMKPLRRMMTVVLVVAAVVKGVAVVKGAVAVKEAVVAVVAVRKTSSSTTWEEGGRDRKVSHQITTRI